MVAVRVNNHSGLAVRHPICAPTLSGQYHSDRLCVVVADCVDDYFRFTAHLHFKILEILYARKGRDLWLE